MNVLFQSNKTSDGSLGQGVGSFYGNQLLVLKDKSAVRSNYYSFGIFEKSFMLFPVRFVNTVTGP